MSRSVVRDDAAAAADAPPTAHGHGVYLRSLTKSTAPGLRIGAIVARGAALARLTACRAAADFFVSGPLQEAALEIVHCAGLGPPPAASSA